MSTVLVTGGAGFLGSHVADALSEAGHRVRVLDARPSPWLRPDQEMIVADIRDATQVNSAVAGAEHVFHLAALADLNAAKTRPLDTVQINIGGTLNILEACRAHQVKRLLFASTVYVYSREGGFYRCSKQACENYIEQYQESFGLPFTILRCGSLYGPRADDSNGVLRLLRQAVRHGRIHYDGQAHDLRNYIHVEDAARLTVQAMDTQFANQHLVLTGHDALRMEELFRMFGEITGRELDIDYAVADGIRNMKGHYSITPYTYTPKPGLKLTANPYIDMGQGLLQLVEGIDRSKDEG